MDKPGEKGLTPVGVAPSMEAELADRICKRADSIGPNKLIPFHRHEVAEIVAALRRDSGCEERELLWQLYEGIYGHRNAENIDPFKTAVTGALELTKAWRTRGEPAERELRAQSGRAKP